MVDVTDTQAESGHGLARREFIAMMSMLMATIAISIDTLTEKTIARPY